MIARQLVGSWAGPGEFEAVVRGAWGLPLEICLSTRPMPPQHAQPARRGWVRVGCLRRLALFRPGRAGPMGPRAGDDRRWGGASRRYKGVLPTVPRFLGSWAMGVGLEVDARHEREAFRERAFAWRFFKLCGARGGSRRWTNANRRNHIVEKAVAQPNRAVRGTGRFRGLSHKCATPYRG